METCIINGNMIKICVLLCIMNGMEIHAFRASRSSEGTAHRQSGACDWPQEYVLSTKCSCVKQTMSCVYDLPKTVPYSITTVIVRKYLGYLQGQFSDVSWNHVEELAIGSSGDFYFQNNSLSGLNKLQTLTVTGMKSLTSFGDVFLDNKIIPNLKKLTVNPGPQQVKPEILLNEARFTGLLKRPLKFLNFSNVLLYTNGGEQLLKLISMVNVLNISDTIVSYPPSQHIQTKSKGRDKQPKDTTLNQTKKSYISNGHSLFHDIKNEIHRTTTDREETELAGDETITQLIYKSFNLKTNISNESILNLNPLRYTGKQHKLGVNIHSKSVAIIEQLQSRVMTGFSSTKLTEDTGPTFYSLDISGAVIFDLNSGPKVESTQLDNSHLKTRSLIPNPAYYLFTVEHIYFDRLSKVDINFTDSVNITDTPIYTKTMTLRGNSLVVMNVSLTLDDNNPIVSIDVSYNKLQYIAKTALWCLKNLKSLNLSWNKLYKMQNNLEFGNLFINLTKLQYLDLSYNMLSYLHRNMFEWNKQLEILFLNNNELASLDMDLNGLESLRLLDCSNNNIKFISEVQINKLSSYFDSRLLPNKTINFQIILKGNPLQCACYSKMFLKMILHYPKVIYNTDTKPLTCSYQGGKITINRAALDKADYLCKRIKIIVTWTIATTVTCVVIGILVVVWWHRRKRRQKQDLLGWFVREFLNGNLQETHLAFIAMSGNEDDRGLMQTVVSKFHALAKQYLNTQKKLILTGYDFTPGFPIVSEAYRMIKASCVVIAFVSKSFCQSKYCMMELQEACKQDKPLILIFTEYIDEDLMPPYMLEVFNRYARGRLEQTEDDEWVMSPDMDKLCDAMVNLAAEQYKHKFT